MDWTTILGYVFSAVTALAGWLVGRRKRDNDFIDDLQKSINLLTSENKKILEDLLAERHKNADLSAEQNALRNQLNSLRAENNDLRERIAKIEDKLNSKK